jgi:hypothetical protein
MKTAVSAGLGLASLLFLGGCVTAGQRNAAELAHSLGVSTATTDTMFRGRPLSLRDVIELTRSRVPDATIVAYLRRSGTTRPLTVLDRERLREAGVSKKVIAALMDAGRVSRSRTWAWFGARRHHHHRYIGHGAHRGHGHGHHYGGGHGGGHHP